VTEAVYAAITGWGTATPSGALTNEGLRAALGVDAEWIIQRTGIERRPMAGEAESTCSLATEAGGRALVRAGVTPSELNLVVVATCTPDTLVPPTAPRVQAALGAEHAGAFDLNAACAGFLTALATSTAMIRSGMISSALVIGADVLSRFIDPSDVATRILFGDGAAAVVLERSDEPAGLLATTFGADGTGAPLIEIPAGGSRRPASPDTVARGEHFIRMNGPEVFRAAVRVMAGAAEEVARAGGLDPSEIELLVCHQANQRIIAAVGERLGLPPHRVFTNVARHGNTSAASIPIALCEAADGGLLAEGSRVVVSAVGAGLTWSAGLLLWTRSHARTAVEDRDLVEVSA
jgi:3-oxoacyl-[acyl-carrier-protein] synthase-3